MKNIIWGALFIGIGLVTGRSLFLGVFGWWILLRDVLGVWWLVQGLLSLRGAGAGRAADEGPAPAGVPAGVTEAARSVLADMRRNFGTPQFLEPAQASRFPHLDLARYDAYQAATERRGFRMLGDFEQKAVNESPTSLMAPTFLRTCVSEQGDLMVAYYQVKPRMGRLVRMLLKGLLNLRWIAAPREFMKQLDMRQCADVETEFDDGTVLQTSNAQAAGLLTQPPFLRCEFMPFGTPLPALLDRHRANLARLAHDGTRRPVLVRDTDGMLAAQKRQYAFKRAWRESVQWVTREELRAMAGNDELADAIHAEVQRLLAAEAATRAGAAPA